MKKKVYLSNAVHPNMNYDRSVKSVIWDKFPQIYRLFLDYVEARPHIKVHFQLPGQTLNSLKICAPDVVDRIKRLADNGQVRFMGTFYSEPVGVCMDGMSVLESAELGTEITRRELGDPEGFFLQELAYQAQMPYIVNRLGLQWTILMDYEGKFFFPYTLEGLDGSRCVGAPTGAFSRLPELGALEDIPDNSFLLFCNDLEIPVPVKNTENLRLRLIEAGFDAEWAYVMDYVKEHGVHEVKKPVPHVGHKPDGPEKSTGFGQWVSKPVDIITHQDTLQGMEAYRRAALLALDAPAEALKVPYPDKVVRSPITWDIETIDSYPWMSGEYLERDGTLHPVARMRHLIAWGTNSDARGWFPLWERTIERRESFKEVRVLADAMTRNVLAGKDGAKALDAAAPGYYAANLFPRLKHFHRIIEPEVVDVVDATGTSQVKSVRAVPGGYEHLLALDPPACSIVPLQKKVAEAPQLSPVKEDGTEIRVGDVGVQVDGPNIRISRGARSAELSLAPFQVYVYDLDTADRRSLPEGPTRSHVIEGEYPTLVVEQQVDWHVHLTAEYVTDGEVVRARWTFEMTRPLLIDAPNGPSPSARDFYPGGLRAMLSSGWASDVYYDQPFGLVEHDDREETYIAALTHAMLADANGGMAMSSCTGTQSFQIHGAKGMLALCMGRSLTSGPRRKLSFHVGNDVADVKAEQEWYKDPFFGKYVHEFVIQLYDGPFQDQDIPIKSRAYAAGIQMIPSQAVRLGEAVELARVSPDNVMIAGVNPEKNVVVLNETCGKASPFALEINGKSLKGEISPFQVLELELN